MKYSNGLQFYMFTNRRSLHIPNVVETRCSGCIDRPTYESAIGSFCTADVGKIISINTKILSYCFFSLIVNCAATNQFSHIPRVEMDYSSIINSSLRAPFITRIIIEKVGRYHDFILDFHPRDIGEVPQKCAMKCVWGTFRLEQDSFQMSTESHSKLGVTSFKLCIKQKSFGGLTLSIKDVHVSPSTWETHLSHYPYRISPTFFIHLRSINRGIKLRSYDQSSTTILSYVMLKG